MKKICKILNTTFSWVLEVDDYKILFQGGNNADYFEKHYRELGYSIIRDDKAWEKETNKETN